MPETRKSPAGNGAQSKNFNAAGVSLMVAQPADFTQEDRHAAYCAGYDDGMHHKFGLDVEDRARALLATWANESRDMATHYAARVGPAWSAMFAGDLDER